MAALARAHARFFLTHSGYPVLFHQARGLLMLDAAPSLRLRGVLKDYLTRLARRMMPAAGSLDSSALEARLDDAAALAGLIGGYRSHVLAVDLPFDPQTIVEVITVGLVARAAGRG